MSANCGTSVYQDIWMYLIHFAFRLLQFSLFDFAACEVNFDNTPVPAENILGGVGGGFKVSCTRFEENFNIVLLFDN